MAAPEAPAPVVTAIIPVRDGGRYLGEAIESVLAQSHPRIELIVVDDGSTDDSAEVARAFGDRLRYLRQDQAGIAEARNRGVSAATGDLIAFLDADDVWLPAKAERQVATLHAHRLDMVFVEVEEFTSPDLDAAAAARIRRPRVHPGGLLPSAAMVTHATMERVGPFDPRWRIGQWVEWSIRAIETGLRWEVVPEVLVRRRLHATNQGLVSSGDRGMYAAIVKEMLDRRRARLSERR